MPANRLIRLFALLCCLGGLTGCGALSALNTASTALDTYDLAAAPGSKGGRQTDRTVVVTLPQVTATLDTDRILIRPDAASIAYLPGARWSDTVPSLLQSLIIRSISATGRVGYVGKSEGGPVPDKALLLRVDAFEAVVGADGAIEVRVRIEATLLEDRDQRVIATRGFEGTATAVDASAAAIVAAMQRALDGLLPTLADWVAGRV